MSVIDYLLVPMSLFPIVRQLIVSNFKTLSDHAFLHIQLSLLCNERNSKRFSDGENGKNLSQDKSKWNDELKEQCRDCLLINVDKVNLCRERIDFDGQQLLHNSLAEFTSTLNDIMVPFFKKRTNNYKSCRSNICDDKPWFNAQCKDLYRRYINCLNIFNRLKSQLNHSNLIRVKKDYKTLERRLKLEYMHTEENMMDMMRLTNPKLFYKELKRKASSKHAVPLKLFHEYFKSLCSSDTDAVFDHSLFHNTNGECVCEELDREITENDILKAIRNLKRDKSHGVGFLNEYFIEYKEVFMPVLLYIFNGILKSGIFPTDWAKAILIPIFKKDNVLDPNNYRGISLVSNFGKLFSSVLNQRLINWSETYKPIPVIYKTCITKIRLRSHDLAIECGRYFAIPRSNRLCSFCKNDIEDEMHFTYQGLRSYFIKRYYWRKPSMYKYIQLMSSNSLRELCNLGKFIFCAQKLRSNML
ncbi:unnamed protein product [Mytilus coruscus]|uniref:Reverse transcriptase domain-containing protein n=1 Tax=Mytilus coruscus TaxID=42192 RepID=A0A6J8AGG6_MYTCO|nr:unnamed protein product [Mytilus coruscus]